MAVRIYVTGIDTLERKEKGWSGTIAAVVDYFGTAITTDVKISNDETIDGAHLEAIEASLQAIDAINTALKAEKSKIIGVT